MSQKQDLIDIGRRIARALVAQAQNLPAQAG